MISELEFRFNNLYQSDLFVNFLHDKFKDHLIDESKSIVYLYKDNHRKIVSEDGSEKFMIKKSLKYKKYNNYKFEYSIEEIIKPFDMKEERKRERLRTRYSLGEKLELHITKIEGKYNEVEIEYEIPGRKADNDDIDYFYSEVQGYIDEFEIHYNNFENLIKEFNPINSKSKYGSLDESVISKPRDIKKNDFSTENGKGIIEGYTITIKANGIQLLLYSSGSYIYFVNHRKYFKVLDKKTCEKFIILGEFFEDINTFSPFDIIYTERRKGIRNHPHHLERLELVKDIIENVKIDNINFYWKKFIPIGKNVKQFEKAIKLVKSIEYPFTDDGLILTPIYHPHNSKQNIKQSTSISEVPEILKIKPDHEKSFDVRVDLSSKKIYAHMIKQEYKGTKKFPLCQEDILWSSIPDEADLKIIELIPVKNENDKWVMKFNRLRSDRIVPNSIGTINDTWNMIHEPLDPDLFKNQGVPRLILQNRRVKTKLLSMIPDNSIIVDLGTGKGGDINRYNKALKVLCIEPDEINRNELLKRIRSQELTNKFHIIPCGAQHTDTIVKKLKEIRELYPEAPVVVSSMLSMTFFWQNQEFLNRFKQTLTTISKESNGAYFYFFTVEGNKFLKYLKENDGKINMKKFKAKYSPDDKYGVSIPGKVIISIDETIVRGQKEFLVNLDDLNDILEDVKVYNGRIEDFLTEHEYRMADASIYGYAKIK